MKNINRTYSLKPMAVDLIREMAHLNHTSKSELISSIVVLIAYRDYRNNASIKKILKNKFKYK